MIDEIVSVVAQGGEYVGKLVSQEGSTVTLKDPRFVAMSQQGMGFAHGLALTGQAEPKEVTIYGITLITTTNDDVANAYRQQVSGLTLPPKSSIIV